MASTFAIDEFRDHSQKDESRRTSWPSIAWARRLRAAHCGDPLVCVGLPGGHERRRAADVATLRQARIIGSSGQAEVGDLGALDAILQQDVRRLDVSVNQSVPVRRGQALGDL
jgi:hypothetical protein